MRVEGLTPDAALTHLQLVRPAASPNPGFRRQLTVYHVPPSPTHLLEIVHYSHSWSCSWANQQMLVRQRRKAARDSQNQGSETESATDAEVAEAEDLTKHYRSEKLRMVMHGTW